MSEHMQSGARPGAAPLPFAMGNLGPVLEVAARTSNACGKAYLAWQDEILRFTSTRLQRDAEFGSNLLKCDKWADAARLQQNWVASTVEDYVSEANRLFELATSLTNDVARTSGEASREAADEARHYGRAMGEQAGAMAEGVSRFTRSPGEAGGAMAEQARKTGEAAGNQAAGMAEEGRKSAEDMTSAARDRGPKRR